MQEHKLRAALRRDQLRESSSLAVVSLKTAGTFRARSRSISIGQLRQSRLDQGAMAGQHTAGQLEAVATGEVA